MSDDKTEEPTAKKMDDAREKGQVGQSQDFNKMVIAAVVLQILLGMTDYAMDQLKSNVNNTITRLDLPFALALKETFKQASETFLALLAITLGPAVLMRLLATWSQFGLLLAPKALMPNLSKLNPSMPPSRCFPSRNLQTCCSIFSRPSSWSPRCHWWSNRRWQCCS